MAFRPATRYATAMTAAIASLLAGCSAAPPQPAASALDRRADGIAGCWVNAYGRTQYRPPLATYTGPSEEAQLMPHARRLHAPGVRLPQESHF